MPCFDEVLDPATPAVDLPGKCSDPNVSIMLATYHGVNSLSSDIDIAIYHLYK